jgi:hypothetical protein
LNIVVVVFDRRDGHAFDSKRLVQVDPVATKRTLTPRLNVAHKYQRLERLGFELVIQMPDALRDHLRCLVQRDSKVSAAHQ